MNKIFFTFFILNAFVSKAQIICIFCYEQNDSISSNVNNLILNGSFETGCPNLGYFCPNSGAYSCDIDNWTGSGGGITSYGLVFDISNQVVIPEGDKVVYFGNGLYARVCSPSVYDTLCLVDSDCVTIGIPPGYPFTSADYGGQNGVALEQTVSGLVVGGTYVLEFWAGGEGQFLGWDNPGVFAVDIGFGNTYLRCKPTSTGYTGTRYLIEFNATSTSHTIKFINWGHVCNSCTELMLDDVRLYTLAELSPNVSPCSGSVLNAMFTAPNHICPGTCANFTNLSTNATSYQWFFPGGSPDTSTVTNPVNICYNTPGNYDIQLIASNATSSDTLLLQNYITVYPAPFPQGIMQNGDTLIANQGATSYQWFVNGNTIAGATNYFYVALVSGDYNVIATDDNGCEVEAVLFNVITGFKSENKEIAFILFPNPVNETVTIKSSEIWRPASHLILYNSTGEAIVRRNMEITRDEIKIDISDLNPGLYVLEMISDAKIYRRKFIKQLN